MRFPTRLAIPILGLAAAATACTEAPPTATDNDASPEAPVAQSSPAPGTDQPRPADPHAAGADTAISAPGAVFDLPANWSAETPSSDMRLAQASIPGSGGEAELTVFYFGPGGGGGLEANLSRWINQVEAETEPLRESFTLGDWTVTWIDVVGILKPSNMGTGPSEPEPGSRLLGAVVEGEGGPWFFKATGPAQTLDEQRDAFLQLLKSGRPQP